MALIKGVSIPPYWLFVVALISECSVTMFFLSILSMNIH